MILVNDLYVFSRPTMYCSFVLNAILLYVHTIISMKAPKVQVQNLGPIGDFKVQVQIQIQNSKFNSKFKMQIKIHKNQAQIPSSISTSNKF